MSITEVVGGLGSWSIQLRPDTPDHITSQLGLFGHVAVVGGEVDVAAVGDNILAGARYVGVVREAPLPEERGQQLSGSGMVFWLGDEDDKGRVLETAIVCTNDTLVQAATKVLNVCPDVTIGTIYPKAGTYTARHQYESPRSALTTICDAFGVEFRVNGNGSVDVGTVAELYGSTVSCVVRRGAAGADLDLQALGAKFDAEVSGVDYSTDVLLLGTTIGNGETPDETFATARASINDTPYRNLFGQPVKRVRMISESGTTSGAAPVRAQLQLNRFARVDRKLKVTAEDYETAGTFRVGQSVYVYDPESGVFDAAREVPFQGEVIHPAISRVTEATWQPARGMTVAYRAGSGAWVDLTSFVTWETGGDELVVGDLSRAVSSRSGDTIVALRVDASKGAAAVVVTPDATIPKEPTSLGLTTTSALSSTGATVAILTAAWTAPTLNTDNSVLTDLDHYVVQYRPQFRAPAWSSQAVVAASPVDLTVAPGLAYDVRVAAVDVAGHFSAWSTVTSLASAVDAIAPGAPADPLVGSYLGQLRIETTGIMANGQPFPKDTKQLNVHVGTANNFTATPDTRVAAVTPFARQVVYATAPYGSTRWVRVIAEDNDGNLSASSAIVSGSTAQVADGDIASLNVGKLVSGTVVADWIIAGSIFTAPFGQRAGITPLGFQAYDAAENQTINFDGVSNLLTGRFRNGLPGTRRVEIGLASGNTSRIDFYAPDNTKASIQSSTATAGIPGAEFIQVKVDVPDSASLNGAWNALQVTEQENIFATSRQVSASFLNDPTGGFFVNSMQSRATTFTDFVKYRRMYVGHELMSMYIPWTNGQWSVYQFNSVADQLSTANTKTRLQVTNTYTSIRPPDMDVSARLSIEDSELVGAGAFSPNLKFSTTPWSGDGLVYGVVLKVAKFTASQRLEVRDVLDSGFTNVWASSFAVQSDSRVKDNVTDLEPGSLSKVRGIRARRYSVKRAGGIAEDADGKQVSAAPLVDEYRIGVFAQDVPDDVRTGTEEDGYGVDLYALATLHTAAIRELADELDKLKKGKP